MSVTKGLGPASLMHAIQAADADENVGAVVVTVAGRGFCAGADMSAVFESSDDGPHAAPNEGRAGRGLGGAGALDEPIVAAVNGAAIGVGLTMILPFDRIVVAGSAKLSMRFIKTGIVPELASTAILPQRCGFCAASDLMLWGRTVLGPETAELGRADQCVADDAVLERARSYAGNPTPQLRWIKQLLTENLNDTDLAVGQRRELRLLEEAYTTSEHREAVAAFMDKRPPVFRPR
ncbi:MAG TPA: enoyl-CoA hydratase-related protein [Acidimicrobiales bacterium]|nr:enoyl-CoA hydratase-related protein [Acidimicrobiales bacterium]